ncbi:hypothetical protein BCR42DRAFT_168002 [Absidia repens]|uniref:TAF6 C-terminal HEAT repeat domain-containing protein n=1 Tax=Absidia repens TaxID=90262 RepID=A0A1X2IUE6_9FUNG|nr:hypothetical protein BCR42DRAFT_168002 [Absidia repens]
MEQDHWSTRDQAATLISSICHQYGKSYHTLQPRIAKALLRAFLDPTKPLTTQYGAIKGLSQLGTEVTRVLVVPNIKFYSDNCLQYALNSTNAFKSEGANKCKEALVDILLQVGKESSKSSLDRQSSTGTDTLMSDGESASEDDRTALLEHVGPIIGKAFMEIDNSKTSVQGILEIFS